MSYNNLKKFVRDQAIRGEDPKRLREGLILNGWDRVDVDHAIEEVYGLKSKIKKTSVFIVILLVVIFSVSLLLIFGDLYDLSGDDLSRDSSVVIDDSKSSSCASFSDLSDKESCYLKKIESGFLCDGLSGDETFFCNRVLEVYLLDAFAS